MRPRVFLASLTAVLAACNTAPPPPPFRPVADLKQLMQAIVEPAADEYWDAVGWIDDAGGTHEIAPTTAEEWDAVRNHAYAIAESGNLLMMQGRAFDAGEWMRVSRGLTDAATTALQAAEAKDVEALFDAGGVVYQACVACHEKYALTLQEQGR